MNELQKIGENPDKKPKLTDFQKKYNLASKHIVHILGTNMALFVCILLPIFLIGFVWTDFGVPKFSIKFVSDGIITVVLFVIGELMMMRVGADGGKLDSEYISARSEFNRLVAKAGEVGTMLMTVFCEWQIDVELNHAITSRLRSLRMTRSEWDQIKDMPYSELAKKYGSRKAKKLVALNQLEPVELNDAILLYDDAIDFARGGVPISGEVYLRRKTHSAELILSSIFTGLLTVSVAITLTSDISFARLMYTVFKLIVLIYRMAVGYELGAKAYNTIEVRQLKVKCNYLRQYCRFVTDKIYVKIGNKYGDISYFVEDAPEMEVPTETPTNE
jgi:hypothetical protein